MSGLFADLGQGVIEQGISRFSTEISETLIGSLYPVINVGVVLYFIVQSYLIMAGRSQSALTDVIITCFKISFISYLGLNAGTFVSLVIGGLQGLETMLLSSLPGHPDNIWAMLDALWEKMYEGSLVFGAVVSNLGISDMGYVLLVGIVWIIYMLIGVLFTVAALGVLVINRVCLELVLGFGPLFLCSLMFPLTRQLFNGWFRTAVTFIFSMVLLGGVMIMAAGIFTEQAESFRAYAAQVGDDFTFGDLMLKVFGFLIISLAMATLIRAIPGIASGLIGSVGIQTHGLYGQALDLWRSSPLYREGGLSRRGSVQRSDRGNTQTQGNQGRPDMSGFSAAASDRGASSGKPELTAGVRARRALEAVGALENQIKKLGHTP
ncbi:MAG: type IV secretion system protein [Succinivibrio sp.]|nr:type IV secretion system protein [Succinivibrio sp.]